LRDRVRSATARLGIYRPLSWLFWALRRKRVLVTYDNLTTSVFLAYGQVLPQLEAATGRRWLLRPAAEVRTADLHSFHAVISMRGISAASLAVLRAAAQAGCRTVYDLDDNLLLLDQMIPDPEHPWRRTFDAARPEIEAQLALADGIKVYSPAALPSFRRYNPHVVAIPGYQIVEGPEPVVRAGGGPVKVGFLGSYYKDDEFAPVVPAILRLLAERAPVSFELFGFLPRALEGNPAISHLPWRSSYEEYRRTLAGLDWEIGLAPLRDLEFNRCKSNNKYREYAGAGIAGIYSDAAIYRDSVADRKTGLLVPQECSEAWYAAILELATDAELRRSIQRNACADVRANYRPEEYVARVAALLAGPWPPPAAPA
jgi:glycosyltransferase involved in cell wall biosynthesis